MALQDGGVHVRKLARENLRVGTTHRPFRLSLAFPLTNIGVRLCGFLVDFHGLDTRIIFRRQFIEHEVAVLVDTDEVSRSELIGWDETDERKEDGLTGARLDNRALALANAVQVYVRTLLGVFIHIRIYLENLWGVARSESVFGTA